VLSCGVYGSQDWSTNGPFQTLRGMAVSPSSRCGAGR
jgi:hypothetical protein